MYIYIQSNKQLNIIIDVCNTYHIKVIHNFTDIITVSSILITGEEKEESIQKYWIMNVLIHLCFLPEILMIR